MNHLESSISRRFQANQIWAGTTNPPSSKTHHKRLVIMKWAGIPTKSNPKIPVWTSKNSKTRIEKFFDHKNPCKVHFRRSFFANHQKWFRHLCKLARFLSHSFKKNFSQANHELKLKTRIIFKFVIRWSRSVWGICSKLWEARDEITQEIM